MTSSPGSGRGGVGTAGRVNSHNTEGTNARCADRHTEKLRARREKCATFVNDCKAVCILENVTGRNDEDITTHCYAFEKADTTTLNYSDNGMER